MSRSPHWTPGRERQATEADWSDSRRAHRRALPGLVAEVKRDAEVLGAAGATARQLAQLVGESKPALLEGEHLHGLGAVEEAGTGIQYGEPMMVEERGRGRGLRQVQCRPMDPTVSAEAERVRELRVARSARDGVRVARQVEATESWRREHRPVMGPARSFLPVMDPAEQVEAGYTLGRHRDVLAEAKEVQAAVLEARAAQEVCQGGAVTPRVKSRRSTRGQGRRCRR